MRLRMTYNLRSNAARLSGSSAARSPADLALRDEDLPEHRFDADGARADRTVVGRHVAPADEALSFFVDDPREEILDDASHRLPLSAGTPGRRRIRPRVVVEPEPPCEETRPVSGSGCRRRRLY